jgi:DNA-binding NarL/FixJ family response regulator
MATALDAWSEVGIVGEATDVDDATAAVRECCPDVVVLHLDSVVERREHVRLLSAAAQSSVLVIAEHDDDGGPLAALDAGARGYGVVFHVWPEQLRAAIGAVARGYLWLCPSSTQRVLAALRQRAETGGAQEKNGLLTEREVAVLRLVADGVPDDTIAANLCLSKNTVKTYVHRMLKKLSVGTREEAVSKLVNRGMLPDRRRQSRD